MKKIKDEELKKLFLNASEAKELGASLSGVFSAFAKEKKLAKGTVRNVYYEYLKRFETDEALKEKFLAGKTIKAEKIIEFDELEARWLLKKVLIGLAFGKSVRRTILEITTGDAKKALRYQNKYRNMIRGERELVSEVIEEIKSEYGRCYDPYKPKKEDYALKRLKAEINDLYEKIAKSARDENLTLKAQITYLKEENDRLKETLVNRELVKDYFSKSDEFVGGKIHKDN